MSNFDVNKFGEEVFKEFVFIKSAKSNLFPGKVMKQQAKSFSGRLFACFVGLLDSFVEKTMQGESEKRKLTESEFYADNIISIAENKKVLCQSINELKTHEIITEEKFVKRFTLSLYTKVLKNDIAIRAIFKFSTVLLIS